MSDDLKGLGWAIVGGFPIKAMFKPTEREARQKAAEWARMFPGEEFFVARTVCRVSWSGVVVTEFEQEDKP